MSINLQQLINNLSARLKSYLEESAQVCINRNGYEITIEDLLVSILSDDNSLTSLTFTQFEIEKEELITLLRRNLESSATNESKTPVFSPLLVEFLKDASFISSFELKDLEISEVSIILSIINNKERYSYTPYYNYFAKIDGKEFITLINGLEEQYKTTKSQANAKNNINNDTVSKEIEKYTINLSIQAKENKLDQVISRENEISQVLDTLLRRKKNNPILLGDAGVGKTAIVEGLALKIHHKEVPKDLANVEILTLDMGSLQAGASVKGEFERRLQMILTTVQNSLTPIILFIDEVHTIIGSGASEGGADVANLLKPALARGLIKIISATTWDEYHKYFEKDPALSRRFQPVNVKEPTKQDSIAIIRGLAHKYEEDHNLYISDDAIVSAVNLSSRYIMGRKLPDKAFDVLDTACAKVKTSQYDTPLSLKHLENNQALLTKELEYLKRDLFENQDSKKTQETKTIKGQIKELSKEVSELKGHWQSQQTIVSDIVNNRKEKIILDEFFSEDFTTEDKADPDYKEKEKQYKQISKDLKKLKLDLKKEQQEHGYLVYNQVNSHVISHVVSQITGIPLGKLLKEQSTQALNFYDKSREFIKGQDKALKFIANSLKVAVSDLLAEGNPRGVFLFTGPSGVGKTQTAHTIADLLYGGESFITTINMSEFQEKHTVSKLFGAPAGYVGYGDGGLLSNGVLKNPYSIILLDEVEKAHPSVLNAFYQIFDKGIANDSDGRLVDYRNCIFILTSNLGSDEITTIIADSPDIALENLKSAITPVLSSHFKPALLGRMQIIPFLGLSQDVIKDIVLLKVNKLSENLGKSDIELDFTNDFIEFLALNCQSSEFGVRNIDNIIKTYILPPISHKILESRISEKIIKIISLSINDKGNIEFTYK